MTRADTLTSRPVPEHVHARGISGHVYAAEQGDRLGTPQFAMMPSYPFCPPRVSRLVSKSAVEKNSALLIDGITKIQRSSRFVEEAVVSVAVFSKSMVLSGVVRVL